MATRKRNALEILSDNMKALMALPGHENLSSGPKLAAVAKVSQKTVNNIEEKRHYPKLDSIEKIARAFKVDLYMLLCPSDERDFQTICKAYSVSDHREKEFLRDTAKTFIEKHERSETGETIGL